MQKSRAIFKTRAVVPFVVAAGLLWLLWTAAVMPSRGAGPGLSRHPRLESALRDLVVAQRAGDASATADFAARHGVTLIEGLVRAVVVGEEGVRQADIAEQIAALGGQVETVYGAWTQMLLPVEALPALADTAGVRFVRRPWLPSLATTSEGVAVTGADEWQDVGYTGQNVKVGVLDVGFLGYTNRISEGELPSDVITRSFIGAGSEFDFWGRPASQHGTACAEVVHDMAPDAQLYLVNAGTEVEWANAVDWLLAQKVDVISFSAGWQVSGPGDGTGTLSEKVNDVREAGILWVSAAGNSAQRHWMGKWNDPEDNWWHNYTGADETNEITVTYESQIVIGLRWDDPWGGSTNDYDLFLFRLVDDSLEEVARSDNVQDGNDNPQEFIVYNFPPSDVYYVAISKQAGAKARKLELFSYDQDFHYRTAASSLWIPADSPSSLTVAATYWQDDSLESFSSQGPTRDGRTKPDLAAPDGISVRSETWRDTGFYGTSASAPHVAGVGALVLEAFPAFTVTQTQDWLEERALDMGAAGKDNVYGAGRLRVPMEISGVSPAAALQGMIVTLEVSGDPFLSTATFSLIRAGYDTILPTDVTWVSVSRLTGTVNLGDAALGVWTAVVTNTPSFSLSLSNAFLVASEQDFLPMIVKNASP